VQHLLILNVVMMNVCVFVFVFENRLRRDHIGNVLERRVHVYPVSVWDSGKPISIAREARQVFTLSSHHGSFCHTDFKCIQMPLFWDIHFLSNCLAASARFILSFKL